MSFGSFRNNVSYKLFVYKSYIKQDLSLNKLQELIRDKTQPSQINA